jgi:capsular polysaccharide biosynthesis protein
VLGTALSIPVQVLSSQINIFPNPTTNLLNIKLNDGNELMSGEIYNVIGQKVMNTNELIFSVENLPSAAYFIKIVTKQGQVTKRFIKN